MNKTLLPLPNLTYPLMLIEGPPMSFMTETVELLAMSLIAVAGLLVV
jgi:hypothetical protein